MRGHSIETGDAAENFHAAIRVKLFAINDIGDGAIRTIKVQANIARQKFNEILDDRNGIAVHRFDLERIACHFAMR